MGLTSFEFGIFILFGVCSLLHGFPWTAVEAAAGAELSVLCGGRCENVIFLLAVTIITYTAGYILDRDMEKKKRKRIVAGSTFS